MASFEGQGARRLAALLSTNGKTLPALIDSGADISLISDSALSYLYPSRQFILQPVYQTIQAINNSPLHVMGSIDLKFDKIEKPLNFKVLPSVNHCFVLGIDAIHAGQGKLNVKERTFHWFRQIYNLTPYDPDCTKIGAVTVKSTPEKELDNLIAKYTSLFLEKKYPDPLKIDYQARIDTGNTPPIKNKMYRTPLKRQEILERKLEELMKAGIIERCVSPWAAPALLVPKPNGKDWRLVGAYMKLNSVTIQDTYPIQPIQNIFDHMRGSTCFSKMDLSSGFWQVNIHPEDRIKTAFVCEFGSFAYKRLPMGLVNSPAIFCRIMEMILRQYIGKFCFVYVDDIVVYSKNHEEHLAHLNLIMKELQKAGVQLKRSKCHFAMTDIELLGFNIDKYGIRPIPSKIAPIANSPAPSTKKQLQSFLGSANYYRRFIPGFSIISAPLYNLLKKDVMFDWGEEPQKAFKELKQHLTSDKVMLTYPNVDKPYKMWTDASKVGVAGVLVQEDDEGINRVVQYYSQKMNKAQQNYSVTEKEALAIINSLKHFRTYLLGSEVQIYTDHRPLLPLFRKTIDNERITRWQVELGNFKAQMVYVPGKDNHAADWLSRRPLNVNAISMNVADYSDYLIPEPDGDILEHITADKDDITYQSLMQEQQKEYTSLKIDPKDSNYVCIKGIWYSTRRPTNLDIAYPRLILPSRFRRKVIENAHNSVCHSGIHRTLQNIRQVYVYPGLREDVIRYINKCPQCHLNRRINIKKRYHPIPRRGVRGEIVAIDLVGPLMTSHNGNKYILTMMDLSTRWLECVCLKSKHALPIQEAFYNRWITAQGVPEYLLSDNGSELKNNIMGTLCKDLGIVRRYTSFYEPNSNGILERSHSTLKDMIRKATEGQASEWEKKLFAALFVYRTTVHSSLGKSPFEMTYGQLCRLPFSRPVDRDIDNSDIIRNLAAAFQIAQEQTIKRQQRNERNMNAKSNEPTLEVGQYVVIKAMKRVKMQDQNIGWWQIIDIRDPVLFIRHLYTGNIRIINRDKVRPIPTDTRITNLEIKPKVTPVDPSYVSRWVDYQLPGIHADTSIRLPSQREQAETLPYMDISLPRDHKQPSQAAPQLSQNLPECSPCNKNVPLNEAQQQQRFSNENNTENSPYNDSSNEIHDSILAHPATNPDVASPPTPSTIFERRQTPGIASTPTSTETPVKQTYLQRQKQPQPRQHCRYNLRRNTRPPVKYTDYQ